MGRLIGLPHFHSQQAFEEEKQDAVDLRRARSELPNDYEPLSADENDSIKACQIKIAERMQQQFEKRVIRRSIDSVDWKKDALNPLPPCHTITVPLDLSAWETEIIEYLTEQVKDK